MFKEKCAGCGKVIEKKFTFCPYCGGNIAEEKEAAEYGLIGKNNEFDKVGNGNFRSFGF